MEDGKKMLMWSYPGEIDVSPANTLSIDVEVVLEEAGYKVLDPQELERVIQDRLDEFKQLLLPLYIEPINHHIMARAKTAVLSVLLRAVAMGDLHLEKK